jgi:hypothetical protein
MARYRLRRRIPVAAASLTVSGGTRAQAPFEFGKIFFALQG